MRFLKKPFFSKKYAAIFLITSTFFTDNLQARSGFPGDSEGESRARLVCSPRNGGPGDTQAWGTDASYVMVHQSDIPKGIEPSSEPTQESFWTNAKTYGATAATGCANFLGTTSVASFLAEPLVFQVAEVVVGGALTACFGQPLIGSVVLKAAAYHCAKALTSQGMSLLTPENLTSLHTLGMGEYFFGAHAKSDLDTSRNLSKSFWKNFDGDFGAATVDFLAQPQVFKATEALGMFTLGACFGASTWVSSLGYKAVSYALAKNIAPEGTKVLCSVVERGFDSFSRCFRTPAKTSTPT